MLTDLGDAGQRTMELLGTAGLIRCAEQGERLGGALCSPEILVFAAVGSDGEHLAFETSRMNPHRGCAVLDARPAYRPDRWWVIARDFTEWLERLVTDPGPPGAFGRHWEPSITQPALPLIGLADAADEPAETNL